MTMDIQHDAAMHRFEVLIDGGHCVLDYTLAHGTMTIVHTGVPTQLGGRGIAAELVRAALAEARVRGWKVVPACSYAEAFMHKHAGEYGDLLA